MNYYYSPDGTEVLGPSSLDELLENYHSGTLSNKTQVCAEGRNDWQSIHWLSQTPTRVPAPQYSPLPISSAQAHPITAPLFELADHLIVTRESIQTRAFGNTSSYSIPQIREVILKESWDAATNCLCALFFGAATIAWLHFSSQEQHLLGLPWTLILPVALLLFVVTLFTSPQISYGVYIRISDVSIAALDPIPLLLLSDKDTCQRMCSAIEHARALYHK